MVTVYCRHRLMKTRAKWSMDYTALAKWIKYNNTNWQLVSVRQH